MRRVKVPPRPRGQRLVWEDDNPLDAPVREYVTVNERKKAAEEDRKELQGPLIDQFDEFSKTEHRIEWSDAQDAVVKVKTRDNLTIDAERLKKALGATTFNRLTTPVLDESKLEAAVASGEVDANIVASCTSENPTRYLEVRFAKRRKTR